MAKNLWVAGESGNKSGRPAGTRYSILTVRGRLERFLNRNMSAKAMQKLFNELPPKDQAWLLTNLLPFVMPRQTADGLSGSEVDALYDKIQDLLKSNQNAKAI